MPKLKWSAAAVCTLGLLSGCAVVRIAPIQLGRVAQQEYYTQWYSSGPTTTVDEISQATDALQSAFERLLGPQNWRVLRDRYGLNQIRDELFRRDIYIRGGLSFFIYLDPANQRQFLLEGTGRYFLIRRQTGEMILSGDFHVLPETFSLRNLDEGSLVLRARLFTSGIPNSATYYNEQLVRYTIFIDRSMGRRGVYRIDYTREHTVALDDRNIGTLRFDNGGAATKLIDLRGLGLFRNDYDRLLQEAVQAQPER